MSAATAETSRRENMNAEQKRHRCPVCQQTFGRVEHLTRHSRSHSDKRSLKCDYCQKGFYRGDALRRHERLHREPKRSAFHRGARACLACAKARRRCSGDNPCAACGKRSINCNYPHSTNARADVGGNVTQGDSVTPPDEQAGELNSGEDLGINPAITNSKESSESWPHMSHSPTTAAGSHEELNPFVSQRSFDSNRTVMTAPIMETTGFQSVGRSPQSAAQPRTSLGSHDNILGQSPDMPTNLPPQPFLRDSLLEFQQGAGSEAQQTWSSGEPASQPSMANNTTQVSRRPEPRFWRHNRLSSINWLPDNWIPDFDFNSGQSPPQATGSYAGPAQISQDRSMSGPDIDSAALNANENTSPFSNNQGIIAPENSNSKGVGYYYVDGDGARLPRIRKALHQSAHQSPVTYAQLTDADGPETIYNKYGFPGCEYGAHDGASISSSGNQQIPIEIYRDILHAFNQTCIISSYFPPFHSAGFPSLESVSLFVSLYTEHFQPTLPFIHPATFNPLSSHWLLVLAMAAIGSHYAKIEHVQVLVVAMHEFLRRAINMVSETGHNASIERLVLTQVRLLSCIGMMYCGAQQLIERAKASRIDLVAFCETEWVNYTEQEDQLLRSHTVDQAASDWKAWCCAESRRRTGYTIWLLDCMWSFQFQVRPLLSLEDARVPVPCQEVLWEASTALDWRQLYSVSTKNLSLPEVIQILYVEKRLQSSTGEFSRILCIHALFRRTWEVEAYFKQPLTLWSPAAEQQAIKPKEMSSPVWLPEIQIYSRWRNSACDCLDVLHWHANSVIGAAGGMEHPTVLHLHLARVVLLTPFRHIVQLALLMTREREPESDEQITEARTHIRRWAMEDQYKARLAMIHAGVSFWHVRRYSVDGFYEPSAVFLATLAMWAYGTFAPHTSRPVEDSHSPQSDEDAGSPFPTSMQLDRPADDELVQLFVKRGGSIRANVTGVGNLCSPKGPNRVLLEGRKLLMDLKCWGYSRWIVRTLTLLIEIC
ncbi:C2H2 transcription factor-like protein [Trichoderma afarasin]